MRPGSAPPPYRALDVNADHRETAFGKGHRQRQAHIAQANDGNDRARSVRDLAQEVGLSFGGTPVPSAGFGRTNKPGLRDCTPLGEAGSRQNKYPILSAPGPTRTGTPLLGTGPQPAVYTNSTTGAFRPIITQFRGLVNSSAHSPRMQADPYTFCEKRNIAYTGSIARCDAAHVASGISTTH